MARMPAKMSETITAVNKTPLPEREVVWMFRVPSSVLGGYAQSYLTRVSQVSLPPGAKYPALSVKREERAPADEL